MVWPLTLAERRAIVNHLVWICLHPSTRTHLAIRAMRLVMDMDWLNKAAECALREEDGAKARQILERYRRIARAA